MVADRVEVPVFGKGAPVVATGGDSTVVAVETVSSTSGVEAEVGLVLVVVRVGAAKEVEVETRPNVVLVKFRGGAAGVVEVTPGIPETVVCVFTLVVVAVPQSVAADVGTDVVVGATRRVAGVGDSGGGVV